MSFPYKHVLLIGATAGIGAAMADKFIEQGIKVTAVGRRAERLDAFVAKHGSSKASSAVFDITANDKLDGFFQSVTTNHPDIDCIMLNAGVQSPINLSKPESFDPAKFHSEINTNFTSFVNISMKFLSFLQTKPSSILFVGSHLGFVPAAGLPAYSASKAALGSFAISLREQLRGSSVKVIDLWPPVVQTELHDYIGDKGRAMGIPVSEFVVQAWDGLTSGNEAVIVGTGPAPAEKFNPLVYERNEMAANLAAKMRAMAH